MTDALLPVLHLALTAAYAGFQWTVRGLVYPPFDQVPAGASGRLRAAAPLPAVLVGAACLGAVLALTALGAVPQHRRLSSGWDDDAFRRLLRVDTLRAVTATAGTAAAGRVLLPLA